MYIPDDPYMLLSFINMKLRDEDYENLSDLCDSLGCVEEDVIKKLSEAGFEYQPLQKQFR